MRDASNQSEANRQMLICSSAENFLNKEENFTLEGEQKVAQVGENSLSQTST